MEMEYLNSILNISLYLQYNTIEGLIDQKIANPKKHTPIPSVRVFLN